MACYRTAEGHLRSHIICSFLSWAGSKAIYVNSLNTSLSWADQTLFLSFWSSDEITTRGHIEQNAVSSIMWLISLLSFLFSWGFLQLVNQPYISLIKQHIAAVTCNIQSFPTILSEFTRFSKETLLFSAVYYHYDYSEHSHITRCRCLNSDHSGKYPATL